MKLTVPMITLGLASASPHFGPADITHWTPPSAGDGTPFNLLCHDLLKGLSIDLLIDRGPCPMMNTLANHNFIPHSGRNITRQRVIDGLGKALNFDESLASLMFDMAIVVNPMPNATWFTLYVPST